MTTATHTRIEAGTWAADPGHSSVEFKIKHFGIAWLKGSFEQFEVALAIAEDGSASLAGSSPVEAVEFRGSEQLRGHLLGPDFFDAQLHPGLSFSSTSVELADDGTATVEGILTMKGVSKPVTFEGEWTGPIDDPYGGQRVGLNLGAEVNRFDFDIAWTAQLGNGTEVVAPTVRLEGGFELVKQ